MSDEIQRFKKYLQANGHPANTIKKYINNVIKFSEEYNLDSVSEDDIQDFLISLQSKFERTTVNNYRASIKCYLIDFKRMNIRIPKSLKTEDKIIDFIDEDYFVNKVLFEVDFNSSNSLKIKTLLCLMYDTGIRPGEIPLLKRNYFDLKNTLVFIRGTKTYSQRKAPFTDSTKDLLDMYFSLEDEIINAFNIQLSGINGIFQRLKPKFSDINFRPDLLRHSSATNMLDQGMPVHEVAKILGHKSIETTLKYYAQVKQESIFKHYKERINQRRWDSYI